MEIHFSWITFSVSGRSPYPTLSISSEIVEDMVGSLTSLFSWLTENKLSLPVPVELERIVEGRPRQSIPCVLMVGLSWTARSAADIYPQLTRLSERVKKKNVRLALTDILSSSRQSCPIIARTMFYDYKQWIL